MQKFIKKWNGKSIQDDGAYTSKEFKSFYRQFINAVKRSFPDCKVKGWCNHYSLSGFITNPENQTIYFSLDIPRYGKELNMKRSDPLEGILYRCAKDENDFHGYYNHFTNYYDFQKDVNGLFAYKKEFSFLQSKL